MNLGTSTYSFWHFGETKQPLAAYLESASSAGFEGIEILEDNVEKADRDYFLEIKRRSFELGLPIYCVSVHNNFVKPSKDERIKEVEKVKKWIEWASLLGASAIRVNSGRWATIRSFDELMEAKGVEPPVQGYSDEEAFDWVRECFELLLPAATENGIILGMENHWGLSRNAENMIRLFKSLQSPYFRAILDTGNFIERTYEQMEAVAPYTAMVQAKTYYGGGVWYSLDIDYPRVFGIIRKAGFNGWVSLEFEGKEEHATAAAKSRELLWPLVHPA